MKEKIDPAVLDMCPMTTEERMMAIEEVQRWLKHRYSGQWWEKATLSLLKELHECKCSERMI